MNTASKWFIPEEEKQKYINILTDELPLLRARAGIPQDDLANVIGFTRQTYSAIERRVRPMSWNIFLALIFFFDTNAATHDELRSIGAYPAKLIERMNNYVNSGEVIISQTFSEEPDILEKLDEQALYAVKAVIMAEYARCTSLPIDNVVKSFNGKVFCKATDKDKAVKETLVRISSRNRQG